MEDLRETQRDSFVEGQQESRARRTEAKEEPGKLLKTDVSDGEAENKVAR